MIIYSAAQEIIDTKNDRLVVPTWSEIVCHRGVGIPRTQIFGSCLLDFIYSGTNKHSIYAAGSPQRCEVVGG